MHHKATKRQTSAKVIKCSLFGAFVSGVRCKKEKKRVGSALLCFKIEDKFGKIWFSEAVILNDDAINFVSYKPSL